MPDLPPPPQERRPNLRIQLFLMDPPPHSFSRSPVAEVFCQCTPGRGAAPLSLAVTGPYPGWPAVRNRVREMLAGTGDASRIAGCLLRYTDLIPLPPGVTLPRTDEIERLLSQRYRCSRSGDAVVLSGTDIPGTLRSVRSSVDRPGGRVWTLVFSLQTRGEPGFASADHVMEWFDDAHAEIHELFDCIVPGEIVQGLR